MSSVEMTGRNALSARIAAGFLVALLAVFGFADCAFGEIITSLQPVAGVPGVKLDAASYSLAEINAAGGIVIGNRVFDSFGVTLSSSANATAPNAASVRFTAVEVNGEYGFKVNSLWLAAAGEWVDTAMTFHVGLSADAFLQRDYTDGGTQHITGVGGANTAGGIATVSENLYASHPAFGGPLLAQDFTYYASPGNSQLLDTAKFAPVSDLWVVTNIGVSGGAGTSGVMAMSEFYQTFHPTQSQIPEPSTLLLLGIAAFGMVGFVWRKRS